MIWLHYRLDILQQTGQVMNEVMDNSEEEHQLLAASITLT